MSQASTGRIGIGVVLEMGDGAGPEVFAIVANVTTMSVGGKSVNFEDATHLDSPDLYSEILPALKSSDEWTMTLQWDPTHATQNATTGIDKKFEDRTLTSFRMNPSAIGLMLGFACSAYVGQAGPVEISPSGIMTRSVTLRPSGKVTEHDFT